MLAMLWLQKGNSHEANRWGKMAWGLLDDLGHLGTTEKKLGFKLERMLGSIGRLGGKGEGKKWRE
jgi:hypothetical protein